MEAMIQTEKAGRNRQLTERDRELCGFLAVCRYLTRRQIERLMFAGRSKARSSTRLRQLAKKVGGQEPLLRGDLGYGSAEGWTTVWALTAEGFEIGSQLLNLKPPRIPKHDVGQSFLRHEVMLNEVFLGLVAHDGKTPSKVPRGFRWVTPAHTQELDAIIARYKAAGCIIGYCPGPSPHETRCIQNVPGNFTCGGL